MPVMVQREALLTRNGPLIMVRNILTTDSAHDYEQADQQGPDDDPAAGA